MAQKTLTSENLCIEFTNTITEFNNSMKIYWSCFLRNQKMNSYGLKRRTSRVQSLERREDQGRWCWVSSSEAKERPGRVRWSGDGTQQVVSEGGIIFNYIAFLNTCSFSPSSVFTFSSCPSLLILLNVILLKEPYDEMELKYGRQYDQCGN